MTDLTDDGIRAALDALLERRTAHTRLSTMGAGSDDLDDGRNYLAATVSGGWHVPTWPAQYGGRDASSQENALIGRVLREYVVPDLYPFAIGLGMVGPALLAHGTDTQRDDWLHDIASGTEIWCQMFSEPDAGSDLANVSMRAVRDGDEWVLEGQKTWTSRAMWASWGICLARTDPEQPKHKGLTMFFLDMKTPGVEVRPIKQINGNQDFNEVYFTDVVIPDSQRLGGEGDGWKVALVTLMNERLAVGGGLSNSVMDVFRATQTQEYGDDLAIEDHAVRDRLADWYCRESGLKFTSYRMITALSRGQDPGPEASISKVVVAANNNQSANFALDMQDYGGILDDDALSGFGNQFQRQFLRSPANRIEGGSDEILRNIIAERVLGMPADMRPDKNVPFAEIPQGKG